MGRLQRAVTALLALSAPAVAQDQVELPGLEPVEVVQALDLESDLDPGEIWVGANLAYEERRYAEAIQLYGRLMATGYDAGHLHYNVGNASLRNGELGRAIAAYRRAQRRRPRDRDLLANLSFARKSAQDAIEPPEPSRALSTLLFWHYGLSPAELAGAAAVSSLLFWGVLALRLRWRESESLRWAALILLIPLLAVSASCAVRWALPRHSAVVIPQEIDVRSGPDPGSVVLFKLHAGTELPTVGRQDGWLRIALPTGQQGWIRGEYAEEVWF